MSNRYSCTRRTFLARAALLSATPLGLGFWANLANAQGSLSDLTAIQAVSAMRAGDIKAEDYAKALLAHCNALRDLNAFITLDAQKVLEAARNADRARTRGAKLGLLHGLPLAIKDSIHTRDLPTTGGTSAFRNFTPERDAAVVGILRQAGAILLGKTNLHELSYGYTSNNEAFGQVRNPYDRARIPGGSSGGTAVAVASRMAPAGLAEDTCGSVRVPAALCGVVGLRPTTPRYPQQGVIPITPKFDQVGPHARTVTDLVLLDSVITRNSRPVQVLDLRGLRIGVPREYFWEDLDHEVARISESALQRLRDAGATLVEADVPDIGKLTGSANWAILLYETIPSLEKYLAEYHPGMSIRQMLDAASPGVKWVLETFAMEGGEQAVPKAVYEEALKTHWPAAQTAYRNYFKDHQLAAAAFPTTPITATPIGQDVEVEYNGKKMPLFLALSRNIAPGNTAGVPGLVLPTGLTSSGLPVSMELDGPQWRDRELLGLGIAAERAFGPIPGPVV